MDISTLIETALSCVALPIAIVAAILLGALLMHVYGQVTHRH